MAMRGSPSRRVVGNPIGGVLRDLDRRERSTTNRATQGSQGPVGPPGPEGPAGPEGPPGAPPDTSVEYTDAAGRIAWTFPSTHAIAPVVAALPVDPAPGDATTVMAVLESVTTTQATIRIWQTQPITSLGDQSAVPAGAGVAVHVIAIPGA